MTDIVESCKELADNDILIHTQDWSIICHTLRNAATEIERLRNVIDCGTNAIRDAIALGGGDISRINSMQRRMRKEMKP